MKTSKVTLLIMLILLACACNKSDPQGEGPGEEDAFLNIRLTDAPSSYDEVNIDLLSAGAFIDDVWYDFTLINPGVYDLLSLTNGTALLLVQGVDVPSGMLTQMRLILGENNYLVIDGEIYELNTPSGQTSGYKALIDVELTGPETYQIILDFDAEHSVIATGNGKFNLVPVIRAYLSDEVGQIAGTVQPTGSGLRATAYHNNDTLGTIIDQSSGSFIIGGIYTGTYTVYITPNEGYLGKSIENVNVTAGNTTVLGIITLDPVK